MTTTRLTSPLVRALEDAWADIQKTHPGLPTVVITIGSGTGDGDVGLTAGRFAAARWTEPGGDYTLGEVAIAGERFTGGAPATMDTLLHEAAHCLAVHRGITDVNGDGRHEAEFAAIATEVGLDVVGEGPGYGWSTTTMLDETRAKYSVAIARIDKAITVRRRREPVTAAALSAASAAGDIVTLRCPKCGRRIHIDKADLATAPVACWDPCLMLFRAV